MKVSILGTGKVGSATAFALVLRGLVEELVLIGRDQQKVAGDANDLLHAATFVRPMNVRAGTLDDSAHSDIVIVTAGVSWSGGGSRLTMAGDNAKIYRELIPPIARLSPDAVLIIVSNPVDVMTHLALRLSGFSSSKVVGTGTLVDTGRFRTLLSQAWQINGTDVRAYILGEHGDSQFPALSVASAGGVKFDESDELVLSAARQAREGGYLVVKQKGYSNYVVAAAAMLIVQAIKENSHTVLPLSVLIDGFHGVRDVCLSMPVVIGRNGVVRMLPVDLDEDEVRLFRESAGVMRAAIDQLGTPV